MPASVKRTAIRPHLVGGERIDVGRTLFDQALGELVQLFVIVGGVILARVPIESKPAHVFLDRIDVLDVLLDRIGVVEAQIAVAGELGCDTEVEADRLRMADVQVAVRFRREAGDHPAAVAAGGDVGGYDLSDEIL